MGGLENLQTAKKYYASTIDLTGGKNTRALFGICMVCFCFFLMAILLISSNYNKNNYYGFIIINLSFVSMFIAFINYNKVDLIKEND